MKGWAEEMKLAVVAGWVADVEGEGRRNRKWRIAGGKWGGRRSRPGRKVTVGHFIAGPCGFRQMPAVDRSAQPARAGKKSTVLEALEGFIGGTDHCLFCLETNSYGDSNAHFQSNRLPTRTITPVAVAHFPSAVYAALISQPISASSVPVEALLLSTSQRQAFQPDEIRSSKDSRQWAIILAPTHYCFLWEGGGSTHMAIYYLR